MNEHPKIESAVEDKIDSKIEAAQLPQVESLDTAQNIASKTTVEQDLKTRGQRNINLIWEATQAVIAVLITAAVIYSGLWGIKSEILNTAFVLVISMYLVRTNHSKTGGVGGTDSR